MRFTRFVFKDNMTNRQTDNQIFYKIETYLDRLLVLEIYEIPNFVKIVIAVLEIVNIYVYLCTYNFSSFNNNWG